MSETELSHLLSNKGLRRTPQRIQVLKSLEKARQPLSAEDIQKSFRSYVCDLATIYRNLQQLEQAGLLEKTFFSDQVARYRLCGPGKPAHSHHIECRKCHKVQVINDCLLSAQVKSLEKIGYRQISHRLEFQATCPDCA
ncbi:MAG: transcriptional repressor [Bdellovibrionaceae bacterium]|nr:transcriptional repressor [Pseudobdellovibrionaceae bacterium]MBX3033935.1 transcriptional repressor [Pseudobdellovibrionaceae bacterium]